MHVPTRRNGLVILGLLVVLVAMGVSTVFRAAYGVHDHSDYTVYTAAGSAVLSGENIYQAHNTRGWSYVYLPWFAIVIAPLARLPVAFGSALWYVLSVATLACALAMSVRLACARYLGLSASDPRIWAIPLILVSPWLISGLTRGQASEVMIALVVASFYWDCQGRQFRAGTALATAALLKAFPAALILYFLMRKRWRLASAFAATMLLGLILLPSAVFGWQQNLTYLEAWHARVAAPVVIRPASTPSDPLHEQLLDITKQRNQSLQALLVSYGLRPQWARVTAGALGLVMLAAMTFAQRRNRNSMWIASAFAVWVLLVAPISESHYFGLLMLPLTLLCATALADPERQVRRSAGLLLWIFALLTPIVSLYKPLQLFRPLCMMTMAIWVCVTWMALRDRISA